MDTTLVKLTQYSKASGCGCKIAPAVLDEILSACKQNQWFESLIVGNESKDDAAVYEIDNGHCVISTTDFFMPIVDDAFDFGQIAACNAISDIYAMGAKPLMAVAILGWPIEKLSPEIAQQVIKGAQSVCSKAGIPLAGGHSVDTQEPLFGLAVTGYAPKEHIKRNNTVQFGDILYLTKPLGIGIMATALKRGLLAEEHYTEFLAQTTRLNSIGEQLSAFGAVNAMTDITGFGLAGHLLEMLAETNSTAIVKKQDIPIMDAAQKLAAQFVFPDNTTRNYNAQLPYIEGMAGLDFIFYCDPQTSGGLLFSIPSAQEQLMDDFLKAQNQFFAKVGRIVPQIGKKIVFE